MPYAHHLRRHPLGLVLAGVLLLAFATDANAQRRGRRNRVPEPSARLQAVTRLTCRFTASAAGVWNGTQAKAELETRQAFDIRFSQIDTQEGTANAVGLGEPVEVTVRLVGNNLHLLDIRQNGDLAVTTVFDEELQPGQFKAVHSRSQYLGAGGGTTSPTAAQYYGACSPS